MLLWLQYSINLPSHPRIIIIIIIIASTLQLGYGKDTSLSDIGQG